MRRTHMVIARTLRADIGADFVLICSKPAGKVSHDEYAEAVSRSQQAQHLARYLAQHLANIKPAAFCSACGIRGD